MSVKLNLHQKTRPYKIDIFGLQDNFIGTLQAYEDIFLGQVIEPRMEIKDDGTQNFTCKIPKYYLSEEPNKQVINPRWLDAENGILAENTRILKITIQFSDQEQKVFPFIIDKIINKRENNFSTYKEIICNGLAFAELGKIGYKIELNRDILEKDFSQDSNIIASIDYWLDKVFPNEKDENGTITKWLTPWCYEIRMDWRGYFEEISDTFIDGGIANKNYGYDFYNGQTSEYTEEGMKNWLLINAGTSDILYQPRDETKIYEKPYVSDWNVVNNKFQPISIESFIEKARYIDCFNSNKYNITQTIAETFEVFCVYEYNCDFNGYFKKTYLDEYGNVWTGKKVVFFNRAIKTENPYTINYQHNLQSISRIIDSSEIYTKMYVNPVASKTMDAGYVSIADTTINPLLDDFILNFDYMYEIGSINDIQKAEIDAYKVKLHRINKKLIEVENIRNDLIVKLNNAESAKKLAENALSSAKEQLITYEALRDNEVINVPTIVNKTNSRNIIMVPQTNYEILQGSFRDDGINPATIKVYTNNEYEEIVTDNFIIAQSLPSTALIEENQDKYYLTLDEYGFPETLFTYKNNKKLDEQLKEKDITTGVILFLEYEYCPKNKYIAICNKINTVMEAQQIIIAQKDTLIGTDEGEQSNWSGFKGEIAKKTKEIEALLTEKENLNLRFERVLGPALREGYWQPETYEDPGEGRNENYSRIIDKDDKKILFDDVLFENEQIEYYYASKEDIATDNKKYYQYIDLSSIYTNIKELSKFSLKLLHPEYKWVLQSNNQIQSKKEYFFMLDAKYYSFIAPEGTYKKGEEIILKTSTTPPKIVIKGSEIQTNITNYDSSNNAYNITNSFQDLGTFLGSRHLYHNAGLVIGFMKKENEEIIPVALLQQNDIDYSRYTEIEYSNNTGESYNKNGNLKISSNDEGKLKWVFPRIFLNYKNVNYDSDNLTIHIIRDEKQEPLLTKFEDYSILLRNGRPYITLKITDKNTVNDILNKKYNIIYQISHANETLYLDAKQIAKDSSKPKYSYEVVAANLPEETSFLELGQLVHINDYNVDIYKEYGYISGLSYQLDNPSKDNIVISNYKTKFEDLFSSISAQNEAMKQNQIAYNIAAASFTSSGEVEQEVLQTTLDKNNFIFNFSNTNTTLDDTGGLVLTNISQYNNGVYGQVALRGGGLFCSNSIDSDGNRIWSTAITPEGINASEITTGVLNTNLIRIYSGATVAFQWNSTGLYAFKEENKEGENKLSLDNYVRLNELGLLYVNNGETQLELGWNGLRIESAQGHVRLTGKHGLQMFGTDNKNPLVTFGNYITYNDEAQTSIKKDYGYGMFFTDINGKIQLQATQNGNLQLVDTLKIGSSDDTNYAGLCGTDNGDNKDPITKEQIRIWAGSETPASAEFTVGENGAIKVTRLFVQNEEGSEFLELTYEKLKKLMELI